MPPGCPRGVAAGSGFTPALAPRLGFDPMMGPWRIWLDAKQARNNDAIPEILRTPQACRLVHVADFALASIGAAALMLCILIGIGIGLRWMYLLASAVLMAGLGFSTFALIRLARLERGAGQA